MKNNDVVIIGAGPAGISAAIQLKRYDIEPVLLEKGEVCGHLRDANLVENYPGFPEEISGKHLVSLFEQQFEKTGIKIQFEKVLNLDYKNSLFFITSDRKIFSSLIVIVASGTEPRKPDFEIPTGTENRVFFGIRHLDYIRNKKIAIIGAGDIAFDYALNLSKRNNIVILNRQKKTKCLSVLWRRAVENNNISYVESITLKSIKPHGNGLVLSLYNSDIRSEYEMHVSYLLFAIGRKLCLDFLSNNIKNNLEILQEMGILYMIGDVNNGSYRQTAIAVGDGIKCAMKVYKKLRGKLNESYS